MTIAAISTAVGEAGIGIVRMSGDRAFAIAERFFKGRSSEGNDRRLNYGHFLNERGEVMDEVMLAFMKAPHTYTREDMVEIYCHGGIVSVRRILTLLLDHGARLAEPGEFTRLAFLNGRIDLAQAEAVEGIISAKTDRSFDNALHQLEGRLSDRVREVMDLILAMLANIQVSIDFPEEDIEAMEMAKLKEHGEQVCSKLEALLATARRGRILKDGLKTVILGKPNVGKSSLMNLLTGENRAIVTDIPGTTRDLLEEYINIDGIPVRIIDTAGIRWTEDEVERIGVERARASVESADLLIAVFDSSTPFDGEDSEIIELIRNRPAIVLLNKSDLSVKIPQELVEALQDFRVLSTSMLENRGIDELAEEIKKLFYEGAVEIGSEVYVDKVRHVQLLEQALRQTRSALSDMEQEISMDCIEVDLRDAWESLGEISGDAVGEDIIDRIFRDFCLGK